LRAKEVGQGVADCLLLEVSILAVKEDFRVGDLPLSLEAVVEGVSEVSGERTARLTCCRNVGILRDADKATDIIDDVIGISINVKVV
jgi:hypothetical protein